MGVNGDVGGVVIFRREGDLVEVVEGEEDRRSIFYKLAYTLFPELWRYMPARELELG